jgi:hypothetical protein
VVNNREPLFRRQQAIAVFCRVFGEAWGRFAFKTCGMRRLEEEWLSFYINVSSTGKRNPCPYVV